jgi:hypothetical protein
VTATGLRYHGGTDSYIQYLSQLSAVTQIDVGQMSDAVRNLMLDAGLRARMGAAGQARARALFDWSVVVPAMQDLFAELDAIRCGADPARHPPIVPSAMPVAPSPMAYFGAFPTELLQHGRRFRWTGMTKIPVREMLRLRDYLVTKRIFEAPDDILRVADALAARHVTTAAELSAALAFSPLRVERCVLWLLKYDYAETEA